MKSVTSSQDESDVKPAEQDTCLAGGNDGSESNKTALDFTQNSSLKKTCSEVPRVT